MAATPLLNREQSLPIKKRRQWLSLLIGASIGILFVVLRIDMGEIFSYLPGQALLIGFVPAFWLGVLLHEAGHAAAGLSAGFELRRFIVGPFFLTKETQGWKLRFLPSRLIAGGLTLMVPDSPDRLKHRYIRMVFGGPIASLMLLVFSLVLTKTLPDSSAVRVLLIISAFLVFVCCLPFTTRSQPTDAKLILLLLRTGPAAERLAAILYILALDTQLVEPRHWPREVIEKLDIPTKDKSYLTGAISMQYAVALDGGNPEQIADAIERALSVYHEAAPDTQRAFCGAAANFHGILRGNAALAEAWLDSARKVKNTSPEMDWDAKSLGAIAWARGDLPQACEFLTRHIALLDRYPASGVVAAERARTVDLLVRAEGAAA